jgi:LysM repeat protein
VLEKAEIRPETPKGARAIAVLFNPAEYRFNDSNHFSDQKGVVQWTGRGGRSLSLDLFFDTYEAGTDVRAHTKRIYGLLEVEPTTHRPPVVTFSWGGFQFRGFLESVNGTFTLFLESGVPVRATLSVTFKEYVDPSEASRAVATESADRVKTYVVRLGDSLSAIAAAEYGDPAAWRPIAAANGIANPRVLAPGRRLVIPPLASRRGAA